MLPTVGLKGKYTAVEAEPHSQANTELCFYKAKEMRLVWAVSWPQAFLWLRTRGWAKEAVQLRSKGLGSAVRLLGLESLGMY